MLTDEILSPFKNLADTLRKIVERLLGFLFLGETPIGNLAENVVYITPLKPGNIVEFPFAIKSLEIYTDTTCRFPVKFSQISPREIQIDPSGLKRVGDKVILFLKRVEAVGDNLWQAYGKSLFDYFREDSEEYREVLLSFLKFYVLGPTHEGTQSIAGATQVLDYIDNGDWWDGLIAPDSLFQVKDRIPRIGESLEPGSRLPFDDLLSNPEFLYRLSRNFGEAYFNQEFPLHFQKPGEPLRYVFNGKTVAYRAFENVLKYHVFALRLSEIPNREEWYARIKAIREGRPTHTFPLLVAWADLQDTISCQETDCAERVRFEIHQNLKDVTPLWYFNSPDKYLFNRFEETTLKIYVFNEPNLYFDFGRFVSKQGNEIVAREYIYSFNDRKLTFNMKPPKKFNQKAASIVPYGQGLLYFNGRFTEHVETPYAFNNPPAFADFGLKIDRYTTLYDNTRLVTQDVVELAVSLHATLQPNLVIGDKVTTIIGSIYSIKYDIDPETRSITTSIKTSKGELKIYRFEEALEDTISDTWGGGKFDTIYTFGGTIKKPQAYFDSSQQRFGSTDPLHPPLLRFDSIEEIVYGGPALLFGQSQQGDDVSEVPEILVLPTVEFVESMQTSFVEELTVQSGE